MTLSLNKTDDPLKHYKLSTTKARAFKQNVFVAIFFLLISNFIRAQPITLEIDQDSKLNGLALGSYFELLNDLTNNLQIEDLQQMQMAPDFIQSTNDSLNLGMSDGTIWLRLRIHLNNPAPRTIVLESRNTFIDHISFYHVTAAGILETATMGDQEPYSTRKKPHRHPLFQVNLESGINQVYIAVKTKGAVRISIAAWDYHSFNNYMRSDYALIGLLFGVLTVMLLYNCFLYFSLGSRSYLYYVLYIFSFGVSQFAYQGLAIEMLPTGLGEWAMNQGFLVFSLLSLMFGTLFAIHFLNMKQDMQPAQKIFKVFLLILGLSIVSVFLIDYTVILKIISIMTLAGTSLLLACGIYASLKGYRPAIFYTLAWSLIIAASFVVSLTTQGILPDTFISHWGLFMAADIKFVLMSLALADRVNYTRTLHENKIKTLNNQLQEHLSQVEQIVEERTETISRIVHNVKSGFLTLNRQLIIADGFTKSCHALLDCNVIANESLVKVLRLKEREAEHLELAIEQVFDDQLGDDISLGQIPQFYAIGKRYLNLEGSVIRNDKNLITDILFTITDITNLERKNQEAAVNGMLLNIVSNMSSFRFFIKHVKNTITEFSDRKSQVSYTEQKDFLHTVKGNSLIFGMTDTANKIHQLETNTTDNVTLELEALMVDFLNRHKEILNINWHDMENDLTILQQKDIENLEQIIKFKPSSVDVSQSIKQWLHQIQCKSAKDIIGLVSEDIDRLAKQYGKEIDFQITGIDNKVTSQAAEKVILSLIHLLRNSVIHGIEDDRQALGKAEKALLTLSIETTENQLLIEVADDGNGFDIESLQKKLTDSDKIITKSVHDLCDVTDLLRDLSRHAVSTFQHTDLYAGRGIGLGAIFNLIDQHHGEIKIESRRGLGTTISIRLPTPDYRDKNLQITG